MLRPFGFKYVVCVLGFTHNDSLCQDKGVKCFKKILQSCTIFAWQLCQKVKIILVEEAPIFMISIDDTRTNLLIFANLLKFN